MKLSLVFVVIWLAQPVQGSGSTCVAPTVEAGATANVTCTFDTDVSGLQFMVRRKRSDGVETVLDCYQLGDKQRCDRYRGVRYDLKPGKVQTLYIVNISKHFTGNYVCEMETTSVDECKPCHLNVLEPAKRLVDNIQAPTEMSNKPQHESSPRREDAGISAAVAAAAATAVATVVAVALIVVFCRLKGRKQQKHGEKEQMKDDKGRKEDKVPTINVVNENKDMQSPSSSSSSASSTLSNETKSLITKEPEHPITV